MPALEQSAFNTCAKYYSRSVTATFNQPTTPGRCLLLSVTIAGGVPLGFRAYSDAWWSTWTLIGNRSLRDIQQLVFVQANAPSTRCVTVSNDWGGQLGDRSMQIRVMEYSGVHATNPIDKINVGMGESYFPFSGYSGNTSQGDTAVVGIVASQYASTTAFGFSGGLSRLFESTSPQQQGNAYNQDWERSRCSIHHNIPSGIGSFFLYCLLAAIRRWICFIICLRGSSSGPIKLSSTKQPAMVTAGYSAALTVFGPLRSVLPANTNVCVAGDNVMARIGPFNYQYRLGGWTGLLIGDGTPYQVENFEGLEGWELRTSDDELPRGDGSLRGIDLVASRQILFEVKVGTDLGGINAALDQQTDVEDAMDTLYRALVPQRDGDWELIWRHPGRPLRMVRVRPTNLIRGLDYQQTVVNNQKFTLIAADPRHYSAYTLQAKIPSVKNNNIVPIAVINNGNGMAFPNIRIDGPDAGAVERVELNNASYDSSFVVVASLPSNSTLNGDMEARAIGANRSVVTIDGVSKYGAWQHPRETFALGPGQNDLHLITTPAGANVTAVLTYRDTYQG